MPKKARLSSLLSISSFVLPPQIRCVFTLKKTATLLNDKIKGAVINKVVEPTPYEFSLTLYNGKQFALVFSANGNLSRLSTSSKIYKSPAVAPNFCMLLRKHILGGRIKELKIVNNDRIFALEIVNENEFKTLISQIVFCCATDESRPILKGALLTAKNGILEGSALDGFRMANSYCDIVGNSADMKIVCPARTLTEISRMLGEGENLKVYADKNSLSVAVRDTVIGSRLYAGEFVKKENVYPIDFVSKVSVKRSELIDSIERASVLIRGEKNSFIQFDIKMNKIIITANSEMGKVEETVGADLDGKELKIAMNGKFVLDAIKALTDETIVLSFNTSVSPFTLTNASESRCQYLVLPVRTANQQA